MSDVAWMSLAVIVGTTAISILVVMVVLRRKDTQDVTREMMEVLIQVPIPGCEKPLTLSPNDATKIIALQNQDVTREMMEVLASYNRQGGKPDTQELQQIPEILLRRLARKTFIEPPTPDTKDIFEFKIGYVGRQFLETKFTSSELADPVSWHAEILRYVAVEDENAARQALMHEDLFWIGKRWIRWLPLVTILLGFVVIMSGLVYSSAELPPSLVVALSGVFICVSKTPVFEIQLIRDSPLCEEHHSFLLRDEPEQQPANSLTISLVAGIDQSIS